jgi:hypothetical protein
MCTVVRSLNWTHPESKSKRKFAQSVKRKLTGHTTEPQDWRASCKIHMAGTSGSSRLPRQQWNGWDERERPNNRAPCGIQCVCLPHMPVDHSPKPPLRVTLHLEPRPICCVKGPKSSLVIKQKAEIGLNIKFIIKLRDQIWWNEFSIGFVCRTETMHRFLYSSSCNFSNYFTFTLGC